MSVTLILSLSLVIQTKPKVVAADAFGPNFAAGSKAFLYMEGTEPGAKTTKSFPVPVASSRDAFQKSANLYSVIMESRNTVEPLANPPSAEDIVKAQVGLAALEKRKELARVDSKTPVQVISSELVVTDTLRNREIQKNLSAVQDPAAKEKALAEISMRLCRVRFTEGKSKGTEVWVWSGYLVDKLPKGTLARSSSTSTRQKDLQLTLDKRKALAAKKKALKAAKTEKERAAAQKAYDQALRDLPAQTAAQNQMLQQQALQEEFLMRQQQTQAQSGVQIGVPIAPSGGLYP